MSIFGALWLVGLALFATPASAQQTVPGANDLAACADVGAWPVGRWTQREWNQALESGDLPRSLAPLRNEDGPRPRGTWVADGRRISWRNAEFALAASPMSGRDYTRYRLARNRMKEVQADPDPLDVWTADPEVAAFVLPFLALGAVAQAVDKATDGEQKPRKGRPVRRDTGDQDYAAMRRHLALAVCHYNRAL